MGNCLKVERLHFVDDEPTAFAVSYLVGDLGEVDWYAMSEAPLYFVLEQTTGL